MATNNHGLINTTHCTCWDVDAYNCVGVAATDMDNGTFVTLGAIAQSTTGNSITGYQFTVAAPAANATGLWVAATPEVGVTLDMQMYSDPRYFYNPAGQPISLKYLQAGVDCIEVDANCYTTGILPATAEAGAYASVDVNGGLVATTEAPASGTYFTFVGFHSMDVGQTLVPTVVLRCARN